MPASAKRWYIFLLVVGTYVELALLVVGSILIYASVENAEFAFQLLLIPLNAEIIVVGLISAYVTHRLCRRLGDDPRTARVWAYLTAFLVPLACYAWCLIATVRPVCYGMYAMWPFFGGCPVIGLIVIPLLVLGLRRLVTPKRVVETGEGG